MIKPTNFSSNSDQVCVSSASESKFFIAVSNATLEGRMKSVLKKDVRTGMNHTHLDSLSSKGFNTLDLFVHKKNGRRSGEKNETKDNLKENEA